MGTTLFAALAGVLSILSPCVLPLVPIVLGTAASEHRFGLAALATGLALSFTAIGIFVATIGFGIGLDTDLFRSAAAVLLVVIGAVLLVPAFQARFALAAAPVAAWTETRFGGAPTTGPSGQFGVGLLLGAVWAPCVGPTLGAASVVAARGEDLGRVALTMLAFGLGAAVPLLGLGLLSRQALLRWRARLMTTGQGARRALGVVLMAVGVLILSGQDRRVEAALVDASPTWLTELTTRY